MCSAWKTTRYTSYTMKDNNNLQVLQNKVNRMLLGAEYDTPTVELLERSNTLSVQQMIAYQTAVTTFKIIQSNKPSYLAKKLKVRKEGMSLRGGRGSVVHSDHSLSIAREGFLYRGATLINKLDASLRNETKLEMFKKGLKKNG